MNKYWNTPLADLEREAYNTQNELALEIISRLEHESYEEVSKQEQVKTKYKET